MNPEPPAEKSYCRNSQFKSARRDGKTSRSDGKSTPPPSLSTSSLPQRVARRRHRAYFVFFSSFFFVRRIKLLGRPLTEPLVFLYNCSRRSKIHNSSIKMPYPPRSPPRTRHRSRRLLHEVQVIFNPLFMTPPPATITVKSGTLLCQTVLQQANRPLTETVAVRNDFQALVDAERQECVVKEVVITHTHSHDADTHTS